MRAALWALLLAFTLTACGGDDGGSSPSPSPPGQDPCAAPASGSVRSTGSGRRLRLRRQARRARSVPALARPRITLDPSAGGRTPPLDLDPRARRGHFDRCRRHRRAPRRGGPHRSGECLRSEGPRPPFHAQLPGRLRRPPGRRRVQDRHRQPDHPHRRRQPARGRVRFPFRSTRGTSGPPSSTPTATSRFARATARARTAASAAC